MLKSENIKPLIGARILADKRALFAAAARGEHDLPIARLLAAARQGVTCFS